MEMQGSRSLPVSQMQAWAALNDPEMLKTCIPGCEKFEPMGADTYGVVAAIKVGPVSARFTGRVVLSDIQPPERYQINFEAQGGVAGFGKGSSSVVLKPTGGDTCELQYSVSSTVGGKIAQLGQRLIDGAAKSMADDFFRRFEQELLRRHPEAAARATAAPSDSAPAAEAMRHPQGPWPTWAWSGLAFGTTFVIALIAFFTAAWGG